MPINKSWSSMIRSLGKTYKKGKIKCRMVGGKSVCVSTKAWTVFFATLKKNKWDESKPRPKKMEETLQDIVNWYIKEIKDE